MIRLIVAIDRSRGMAKNGVLPWKIPEDSAYYRQKVHENGGNVLTGKRTFETMGRINGCNMFVLTHDPQPISGATPVTDLPTFLNSFTTQQDLWIVGGAAVFDEVMQLGVADELYVTHIDAEFGCDKFFPEYEQNFTVIDDGELREQNGFIFNYCRYGRKG